MTRLKTILLSLYWLPFVLCSFIAVLWLSWQALSLVNFNYPFWYQTLDINAHIEKFAPQNRHRHQFELTTDEERYRLFAEVVDEINTGGNGLAKIEYHDKAGKPIATMYWQDEVTHLQDVANLITFFDYVAYFSLTVVLAYVVVILKTKIVPRLKLAHAGVISLFLALGVIIVAVGPKAVFYWLHKQVFPPENPWFFYYQDSLMSTSMKAPDLFGAIAAEWFALTLILYICWLFTVKKLVVKNSTL